MSERTFRWWVTVLTGVFAGMIIGSVGRMLLYRWPELWTVVLLAMLAPVHLACSVAMRRWGWRGGRR